MFKRMLVATVVVLGGCTAAPGGLPNAPWPTKEWATSSPEAEGLDKAALDKLDAEFASGARGQITGMLVIRNGKVVMDKSYAHDFVRLFEGRDPVPRPYNYYDPAWYPFYQHGLAHAAVGQQERHVGALRHRHRPGRPPGAVARLMPSVGPLPRARSPTSRRNASRSGTCSP